MNAISMDYSSGHYKPSIDASKCIHCRKCEKACPGLEYSSSNRESDVISYALAASDEERKHSSSGAIFALLATYTLQQGGYVCGAAWDEAWNVHHIIIDKIEDLPKLRFSKYVQSYLGFCFTDIKKLLNAGKPVLFSGVPCQNAGLLKFLRKKYDNLTTVDILCHGAPSPKVWQDYLHTNYNVSNITDICFRSKEDGWRGCSLGCYDAKRAYINEGGKKSPIGDYYKAFLKHILSNAACLECPFKHIPRPADITLGDFWYYSAYDTTLNDGKGLAVVLANSATGRKALENIRPSCKLFKEIDLKQRWEHIEITKDSKATDERELFLRDYGRHDINKSLRAAIHRHFDVALLGMFGGCNYGSALVSYAAQEIIKELGYSVVMLHKKRYSSLPMGKRNRSLAFAKTHCYVTRLYGCSEDISEVNDLADTFVVGSDTNWWWSDVRETKHFYWLDFVHANKRKIAFATSFAHSVPAIPSEEYPKLRYLYSRFDRISTREATGVDNLKELFHVDATHLLDPTLIAAPSVFEKLAAESTRTDKGYVFAYMLDLTQEKEDAAQYISKQMGLPLKLVPGMTYAGQNPLIDENYIDIVDFIYFIKNADYVITDSFHGTAFSVIFQRPFVSLINAARGLARYDLFNKMGLNERLIADVNVLYRDFPSLNKVPDFTRAEELINQERKKALTWLQEALSCEKKEPTATDLLYDYIYSTQHEPKSEKADEAVSLTRKVARKLLRRPYSLLCKYRLTRYAAQKSYNLCHRIVRLLRKW